VGQADRDVDGMLVWGVRDWGIGAEYTTADPLCLPVYEALPRGEKGMKR